MNALQKLKWMILVSLDRQVKTPITADNVDALYEVASDDDDDAHGIQNGMREGTENTNLPCGYSRHYESRSVASRAPDGSWVGWTYWYGGGKHGQPQSIDWMEEAYDVHCVTEMRPVNVFSIPPVNPDDQPSPTPAATGSA